nr:MAG TPA: major capsid protein [Caudoviricetes sp.]
MNLQAQRAAVIKAAQDTITQIRGEGRDATEAELAELEAKAAAVQRLTDQIDRGEKADAIMRRIDSLGGSPSEGHEDESPAKSIGEHFIKALAGRPIKALGRFETPEFKAATDTQLVGGPTGAYGPLVTEVDRQFAVPYRQRLVVADLCGQGVVSGTAVQYPVFPAKLEGATGAVAEAGKKPQVHAPDPTWVTDPLGEIAGWFDVSDDMLEDLEYVVSEIESSARYDLLHNEETQILSGDGNQPNLRGLLNRSGIQTAAKGADTTADAIFKTFSLISNASNFEADAIVINPADYEQLRLGKDGNGQYFGGGYFAGPYGNGTFATEPPVWGRRTVVTPAIAAGTVLVGAFSSAKVLRKGGLRVESSNSHAENFIHDKVTIRLKERLGLQVKYPAAFVKLSLA